MKLQTIVDIAPSPWKIGYEDKILLLGSCFADSVGQIMAEYNLPVTCNPFGTLYNPLSIAQALTMQEMPSLVEYDGLWHSIAHHGSFSRPTETEAHEAIRASIETMQKAFAEASVVIVTFGTAWVYELVESQKSKDKRPAIVANCHKMPADRFSRRRLAVDEIVETWRPILERSADKHWIFTVSPIRHVKDGLHENQLSKATLLQAVEEISRQFSSASYFPSYEIVLDELRDYRFYADDLVHPSSMAVKYIWERFADVFMTPQTRNQLTLEHKRWQFDHHRPLHPSK